MNAKSTLAKTKAEQLSDLPHNITQQLPQFITAYGAKLVVQKHFDGPGRTKQAFKDECDINNIMARYMKTGVIDFVNKHQGQYGDVTGLDYQEAMETIAQSKTLFNELPSTIRSRFENDPALFLDFVHDPANEEEMHELGLMRPDAVAPSKRPAPVDLSEPQVIPASIKKDEKQPAEGGTAKA